jgi:hypothetical protein
MTKIENDYVEIKRDLQKFVDVVDARNISTTAQNLLENLMVTCFRKGFQQGMTFLDEM